MTAYRAATDFPRREDAPGLARGFVEDALAAAGRKGDCPEALLLVSELVTNAVVHARSGAIRLEVQVDDGTLRCVVVDDDPDRQPTVRADAAKGVGGLGLVIVDAVATRWGCDIDGDTKSVWFELDPEHDGADRSRAGSVGLDGHGRVET
jgi:anti-sigma regulatory factor (Ser/Thr protein kinase)